MHLCLTVECITSGLHLSVFSLGHTPPLGGLSLHDHPPCMGGTGLTLGGITRGGEVAPIHMAIHRHSYYRLTEHLPCGQGCDPLQRS